MIYIDVYFKQIKEFTERPFSGRDQKPVASHFQFSHRVLAALLCDKHLLAERTIHIGRQRFVCVIFKVFEGEHLEIPAAEHLKAVCKWHAKLRHQEVLGSLNCSGWAPQKTLWQNNDATTENLESQN